MKHGKGTLSCIVIAMSKTHIEIGLDQWLRSKSNKISISLLLSEIVRVFFGEHSAVWSSNRMREKRAVRHKR